MTDPTGFEDAGPLTPVRPSRLRQIASIAIVLSLIVSMVFLAWVSGRGEIEVRPVATPTPAPTGQIASRPAVVDADGQLVTMDARGGSVVSYGTERWAPASPRRDATVAGCADHSPDCRSPTPSSSTSTARSSTPSRRGSRPG